MAARGGYGSVQILPFLNDRAFLDEPKAFIGYSDNTSLLTWLTLACGVVSFHGPMIEGRFARGAEGYDRDTFERCVCRTAPPGEITDAKLETLREGEAAGMLVGGTLAVLTASLGTPFAFEPPDGCVLFIEDVGERPYRIDRMLTHLTLAGVLRRSSALVFGEMRDCDEAGGQLKARGVIERFAHDFDGPVLLGFPSGHTTGPTMTLPFGVHARVLGTSRPALIIEEAAVS
jgi:muramoyltetrapeptide carboxypeptidase